VQGLRFFGPSAYAPQSVLFDGSSCHGINQLIPSGKVFFFVLLNLINPTTCIEDLYLNNLTLAIKFHCDVRGYLDAS